MMMLLCTFQWSMKEEKHTIDMMVKYSNFQTSAVELASLEQRKSDSPSPSVYRDLTRLRQDHILNEGKEPTTKLASLLGNLTILLFLNSRDKI